MKRNWIPRLLYVGFVVAGTYLVFAAGQLSEHYTGSTTRDILTVPLTLIAGIGCIFLGTRFRRPNPKRRTCRNTHDGNTDNRNDPPFAKLLMIMSVQVAVGFALVYAHWWICGLLFGPESTWFAKLGAIGTIAILIKFDVVPSDFGQKLLDCLIDGIPNLLGKAKSMRGISLTPVGEIGSSLSGADDRSITPKAESADPYQLSTSDSWLSRYSSHFSD